MAYKIPAHVVDEYQIEARQQTFQLQRFDGTQETRPAYMVHTLRLEIYMKAFIENNNAPFGGSETIIFDIPKMGQQFIGHITEHSRNLLRDTLLLTLRGDLRPLETLKIGVSESMINEPGFKYHRLLTLDD